MWYKKAAKYLRALRLQHNIDACHACSSIVPNYSPQDGLPTHLVLLHTKVEKEGCTKQKNNAFSSCGFQICTACMLPDAAICKAGTSEIKSAPWHIANTKQTQNTFPVHMTKASANLANNFLGCVACTL